MRRASAASSWAVGASLSVSDTSRCVRCAAILPANAAEWGERRRPAKIELDFIAECGYITQTLYRSF